MSAYTLYIRPGALRELRQLPGHVRQRMKRLVDKMAVDPRPSGSVELSEIVPPRPDVTLHRLRLEKWRIIYAIQEDEKLVDILAIRQRPPYDYGDLSALLQEIA